jgi:C-terminal processing protease CtpA/Prc
MEDPHLWVETEGQKFETGKTKIIENNFNSVQLFPKLQNQKISKSFITITGVIDSIGYISIRDWNTDFDSLSLRNWGNSKNPEISAYDILNELFEFPNLVIDVRENAGGNEIFAKKFASNFISDSVAYEKVISYNEKTGKFDAERVKWLYPNEKSKKYTGNIYVLSGPAVMSSNESFILMMKQVLNTKIVGMKTYGSSGNPIPYDLSNGVTIYLPSWQAYTLDGKLIEGNGIEPDIEIITSKKDFQDKDILFEKAVRMINQID